MSNTQRAKAAIAKKKQTAEPTVDAGPAPETAPPSTKREKRLEQIADDRAALPIVHYCGHKRRISEIQASHCPQCAAKMRKANLAAFRARLSAEGRDARMDAKGRLPDGSRFDQKYDAASQTWSGRLEILEGDTLLCFEAEAPGVFKLLVVLDNMYREHLGGGTALEEATP